MPKIDLKDIFKPTTITSLKLNEVKYSEREQEEIVKKIYHIKEAINKSREIDWQELSTFKISL